MGASMIIDSRVVMSVIGAPPGEGYTHHFSLIPLQSTNLITKHLSLRVSIVGLGRDGMGGNEQRGEKPRAKSGSADAGRTMHSHEVHDLREVRGGRENHGHGSNESLADRGMIGLHTFTAPWPGPGNSEGPPNGVTPYVLLPNTEDWPDGDGLLATDPWPGPGDSEGPVYP